MLPRTRGALQRLFQLTVWHPSSGSEVEGPIATSIRRWVLPLFDIFLIAGCWLSFLGGLPSVAIVYSPTTAIVTSIIVFWCAVFALIGVSFPRAWVIEMVAKVGLSFVLVSYALLLFWLALSGAPSRGFIAGVCAAASVIPLARVVWLGKAYRRRKIARLIVKESHA